MMDVATVAQDWDAVAEAWDVNADEVDGHSTLATATMIERVGVRPGDRVLELAAGPGTLASVWHRAVGADGSVVVSDLAPAMVDAARQRNASLDGIEFVVLDASAIDRSDASFDVVVSRMGLMFTPDPAAALAEIHRVLAPGGRLAAMTWAGMEHNPWLTCVGMAAMINGIGSGPPIGPGGIFSLGDPARLEAVAVDSGFEDVVVEAIPTTFRASTIDEHIARVGSLAGPLARLLREATDEQRDAVRRTAADLAAPHVTADGVELPGRALVLSAVRPS